MVVHIITTGHDKFKISSGTSVLVASLPMNPLKCVKLSQAFQISKRNSMLQNVVKITYLLLLLLLLLLMLCPRACTYVCMYGLGIYESYLKQFSTQGAEYLTKCENAICIINATAVD